VGSAQGAVDESQGAGRVIVWDRGTYTNDSPYDMAEGLRRGHLSFELNGERLRGGYTLTRIRGGVHEAWLLVKKSDEYADARGNPLRSHPQLVLSGRMVEGTAVIEGLSDEVRPLLRDESVPDWRAPMLATLTDKRFSDPRWVFELKFDGERCLAFRDGPRLWLLSRNRQPLDDTYPELVDALTAQHKNRFVVDGEVVAFQGRRTSFEWLQARLGITDPEQARASPIPVFYYVFDVLHLDGCATTELPLIWRKRLLHDAFQWGDRCAIPPAAGRKARRPTGKPAGLAARGNGQAGQFRLRRRAPFTELAQVKMRFGSRVRDRRLHPSEGQPSRAGCVAGRLLQRA
jgi:ATP-dependent DNA ligase